MEKKSIFKILLVMSFILLFFNISFFFMRFYPFHAVTNQEVFDFFIRLSSPSFLILSTLIRLNKRKLALIGSTILSITALYLMPNISYISNDLFTVFFYILILILSVFFTFLIVYELKKKKL
jgi:hypothetical protein